MLKPWLLPILLACSPMAVASESEGDFLAGEDALLRVNAPAGTLLSPAEQYDRTQAVLHYFQIAAEKADPQALAAFSQAQSAPAAARILQILDPSQQFAEFFTSDSHSLLAFLDKGIKRLLDYRVAFAESENVRNTGLLDRFRRAARTNPGNLPLRGLKIALDPGHMGTDLWDIRTGKFVKDDQGNKISEGLINLQTALLLEYQLKLLGAEVLLTHRQLAPVQAVPYEQLPLQSFAREELSRQSLAPWFVQLLGTAPAGPALFQAFEQSPQVKKIFSEFNRGNYFILRSDLQARSEIIEADRPDITVIIHYDTGFGGAHVGPHALDGTKAYVVGAFEPGEFARRDMRLQLARHMVDREGWDSSFKLGHLVVNQLKQDLGIDFSKGGGGASQQIEPGLFARNLGIPSRLAGHAVTYVEVLDYDDPNEFKLLRDFKHSLKIDGLAYGYSDRLVTAATAIQKGIVSFVQIYKNQ